MNRADKVLHSLNRLGVGLEIGPAHRPIAPKREGFNVTIIDHLDRDGLVEKYTSHGIDTSCIEEVDLIWKGESYKELTGKEKHYDWVIACHLIEHVPDLIGFLNNCEEILKRDGVLSLAIPDKRRCFDYFRPKTGIASVIDAYTQKRTKHSVGTVAEYYLNATSRNDKIAWGYDINWAHRFNFVHSASEAKEKMKAAQEKDYIDVHAWCFTPSSFRLLIVDLYELGYTTLREKNFFGTRGHEFYISLSADGSGPKETRMELSKRSKREG